MLIGKLFKKLIGFVIAAVIVIIALDFLLEDDSIISDVVETVSDIKDDLFDDYDDDYDDYDDYDYDDYDDYDDDDYDDYDDDDYDDYDDDYYGSSSGHHGSTSGHHGNNQNYSGSGSHNNHSGSGSHSNNQTYSIDYDNQYSEDSWYVMDYLFSYIGDDYGYDDYDYDDYDHYYNYNDYYNDYDYDYDYDYNYDFYQNGYGNDDVYGNYSGYDDYDYYDYDDDDYYYGEKPTVTTSWSGDYSSSQDVTPVSVSTQRQRFIEYALSLRGTPYLYGGKTPSPGIDCSGLVAFAARKAISVNFTGSAQMMYDSANDVQLNSAEPGDLLFFSDTGYGITHVGIFLGRNNGQSATNQRMMVHSASDGSSTGVIVSSIDQSNYWSNHLVGAKSFLTSSSEVRSITKSKNKTRKKSSSEADFKKDPWWDDVDASWFQK